MHLLGCYKNQYSSCIPICQNKVSEELDNLKNCTWHYESSCLENWTWQIVWHYCGWCDARRRKPCCGHIPTVPDYQPWQHHYSRFVYKASKTRCSTTEKIPPHFTEEINFEFCVLSHFHKIDTIFWSGLCCRCSHFKRTSIHLTTFKIYQLKRKQETDTRYSGWSLQGDCNLRNRQTINICSEGFIFLQSHRQMLRRFQPLVVQGGKLNQMCYYNMFPNPGRTMRPFLGSCSFCTYVSCTDKLIIQNILRSCAKS